MIEMVFEKPSVKYKKDQLFMNIHIWNKSNTYHIETSISLSFVSKIKSHNNGMAQEIKSHCETGFPLNKFEMAPIATKIHINL